MPACHNSSCTHEEEPAFSLPKSVFPESESESSSAVQGTVLDGHKLALQLSMRKGRMGAGQDAKAKQEEGKEDKKGRGTKLVVRNVAFEATRKDLMALFTPFGQIKSCRLPKKMDGNHRSDTDLISSACVDVSHPKVNINISAQADFIVQGLQRACLQRLNSCLGRPTRTVTLI